MFWWIMAVLPHASAGELSSLERELLIAYAEAMDPELLQIQYKNGSSPLPEAKNATETRQAILNDLFRSSCDLPEKIQKKLKTDNWIPESAREFVKQSTGKNLLRMPSDSFRVVLHTVDLGENARELDSVSTYDTMDINQFMNAQKDNYAFSADCMAMATMMAEAKLGLSAGQVRSLARGAASKGATKLVYQAVLYSPINSAIQPLTAAKPVATLEAIEILAALAAYTSGHDEDAELKWYERVDLLTVATAERSTLGGSIKVDTGGDASIGVVSIRATASGALSSARSIEYTDFDTYVNLDGLKEGSAKVKIVRARLDELLAQAGSAATVATADGMRAVTIGLPERLCKIPWNLTVAHKPSEGWESNEVPQFSTVTGEYAESCKLLIKLTADQEAFLTPNADAADKSVDQQGDIVLEHTPSEGGYALSVPVKLIR